MLATAFLLSPMTTYGEWTSKTGDATGARYFGPAGAVAVPLSERGTYRVDSESALTAKSILADSNYFFLSSSQGLTMVSRQRFDRSDSYSTTDHRWEYGPLVEPPMTDALYRLSSAILYTGSSRGIVLLEHYQGIPPREDQISIVQLQRATGEELWRHDIMGRSNAEMIAWGGTLYIRYAEPLQPQPDVPHRIIRIASGSDEPAAIGEMESFNIGPVSALDQTMVASSTRLFAAERVGSENRVSGFSRQTLERLWSYPVSNTHSITEMISVGGDVLIGRGDGVIISLDEDGGLNWAAELPVGDQHCGGALYKFASDGETLVVANVCDERVFGFDIETGAPNWTADTPYSARSSALMIAGETVHITAWLDVGTAEQRGGIVSYDVMTGEPVGEIDSGGSGFHSILIGVEDHLVGKAGGAAPDGLFITYETEPANVTVAFEDVERFECGKRLAPNDPLTLSVHNTGGGVARDVTLQLSHFNSPIQWEGPDDLEWDVPSHNASMNIVVGDVQPQEYLEISFHVDSDSLDEMHMEVSLSTESRNLADVTRDQIRFDLIEALPDDPNVWIDSVEVTQGLQDEAGSIPLISRRPTLVRVYADADAVTSGVQASMTISGSTEAGSFANREVPLLNECRTLSPSANDRGIIGESFNFVIPPDLLDEDPTSTFTYEITLDPYLALGEEDRSGNVFSGEMNFTPVVPVCLVTHSVRTLDSNEEDLYPSTEIPDDVLTRAHSLLPVSDIHVFPTDNAVERWTILGWRAYSLDPGGSQNTWRLMTTLWMHNRTSRDPVICRGSNGETHYTGIVGEDVFTTHPEGHQFAGYGMIPGRSQAYRQTGSGFGHIGSPFAGRTLAHELAHNYGRKHVDCGDPSMVDSDYPYDPCLFSPTSNGVFHGADLADITKPRAVPPSFEDGTDTFTVGDLLSYSSIRWTSDYTWMAIFDRLADDGRRVVERGFLDPMPSPVMSAVRELRGENDQSIILTARVDEDGSIEIGDVLPVSSDVVPFEKVIEFAESYRRAVRRSSGYEVELLDYQGTVLSSIPVEVNEIADAEPPVSMIGALLPMSAEVESVRIVDEGGTTLDLLTRSSSPPTVELLSPSGGSDIGDTLEVAWSADDPDGGELSTLVQYSDDDGVTWTTLVTNAPQSPLELDAARLPGSFGMARIRLIVSDGFNATEVISDSFTVALRDPVVRIVTRPGTSNPPQVIGSAIFLRGNALDPEDGPLSSDSLTWEIDEMGVVGQGANLLLHDLEDGEYIVTLTAEDSDGQVGSDEITLVIGHVEQEGASAVWVVQ